MNVNDIEKIAKDLTDQATLVAHQYGPQAWAVVCGVKRVDSIGYLLAGLLCLIAAGIIAWFVRSVVIDEDKMENEGLVTLAIFGGMGGVGLFAIGVVMFADVWNWVGAIDPGLAIAHDVIVRALSR